MAEATDPSERIAQELAQSDHPKPGGDAASRCFNDAIVALAVAFPLALLFGREPHFDEWAMWIIVVGVGIISYAVRVNRGRAWRRDYRRRVMQIVDQEAREE